MKTHSSFSPNLGSMTDSPTHSLAMGNAIEGPITLMASSNMESTIGVRQPCRTDAGNDFILSQFW